MPSSYSYIFTVSLIVLLSWNNLVGAIWKCNTKKPKIQTIPTPPNSCVVAPGRCTLDSECCSKRCNTQTAQTRATDISNRCLSILDGGKCTTDQGCFSKLCDSQSHTCFCKGVGELAESDAECCTKRLAPNGNGTCYPRFTLGDPCSTDSECASGFDGALQGSHQCINNKCDCNSTGIVCTVDDDCCRGGRHFETCNNSSGICEPAKNFI